MSDLASMKNIRKIRNLLLEKENKKEIVSKNEGTETKAQNLN